MLDEQVQDSNLAAAEALLDAALNLLGDEVAALRSGGQGAMRTALAAGSECG